MAVRGYVDSMGCEECGCRVWIGLNYDFAVAKKVSINTTFSGVIDDFNPAYGVGIAYSLGGGDLYAGYAFTEDNVAGIKIEDSALNIGYSLNF